MPLHLLKMAVGVDDPAHLAALLAARIQRPASGPPYVAHRTRFLPRRADEILPGGSLYWIVRGRVRVRQPILGFVRRAAKEGGCEIRLAPDLVATRPQQRRPMRGWRYLEAGEAPPDLPGGVVSDPAAALPEEMAEELRALGLI
ncbi:MAG: DUF1489 family protein [Alphaproteobacteria bacterium]|nr:DUF1489 family protein [Alphaproteobacteria bacterium]